MAAPKEVGLRVEDFLGVNVQVSSEDLQDQFFVKMQNLYERKIGELQRRGGAAKLTATAVPTNISKFVGQNYLKDKILGKTRILKATCTDMGTTPYDATAKITLSFPTDVSNGKWGASTVGITNGVVNADAIFLVGIGFGYCTTISYTTSGSYPVSGDTKKLRIVIASALADKNITQIEVYGLCTFNFPGGTARKDYVYIGNIDLLTASTGTFDFNNGPISLTADPGAASIGSTDTVFTAVSASNGGSLTPNKVYYVALMRLYLNNANDTTSRIEYITDTVSPVTIHAGDNSILVSKTSGGSAVTLLAVGLHPQCLSPVGIISNDSSFTYYINALPPYPVSAIGYTRFDASTNRLYFKYTDISRTEMFAKIVNDVWVPVPICNFSGFNTDRYFQSAGDDTRPFPPFSSGTGRAITVTTDAKYTFAQYFSFTQDMLYSLGRGTTNLPVVTGPTHNIVQCDGRVASLAVLEYGTGSPPIASYPLIFKEKLCLGGGPSDAFNRIYFSLVTNCYNFGVPGASATAQYVQVESGGEEVSGIGQYTNTSSQTGPLNQIVVGKQNSLFILSDLPTYSSGSLNNAVMTGLSRKVGVANHDCIQNSDIGTIIASRDNVWLVRETGEPVPLGHEISYFLRPQDPSVVVDPSNWNACVHDNRYKLSFSVSGSAIPSQELWLNIGKMKQMKGQPCWEGPHTGREVRYSFNEEQFLDTIIPKRICVDNANLRWYQADREDVVQDFTTDIACILEGRNFPMGDPNYPKNFTGTMWRIKADTSFVFTEDLITLSDSDGESTLSASRTAAPYTGYTGGTYATFLNCRAKAHSYFPASRIRGETLRMKWSYTGQAFFAISGFTAFYETERRRANT